MNLHEEEQTVIQDAMIHTLSGLKEDPWLTQRILANAKGAEPVKKKISVSLILVIALIILSLSAALAAGLGLFGTISGGEFADKRLPALNDTAEEVFMTHTTEDGVVIEIGQAYYEGNRIFISYRVTGETGTSEYHDGAPEGEIQWDEVQEGYVVSENLSSENPEIQKQYDRMNGKGQCWHSYSGSGIHDGLFLEDGTYLDIIAGNEELQEDGSYIGWKECEIPEDRIANTLTFKAVMYRYEGIDFQDGTTFKTRSTISNDVDIPFTVTRNNRLVKLRCDFPAGTWQGWADVVCGRIDSRITTHQMRNPDNSGDEDAEDEEADSIVDWVLYEDGQPVGIVNDMSWEEDSDIPGESVCTHFHQRVEHYDNLALVPFYSETEDHPDEAVRLERVEE